MNRIAIIATNEFDAFAGSEILWSESAAYLSRLGTTVDVVRPQWATLPDRIKRLDSQAGLNISTAPRGLSLTQRILCKFDSKRKDMLFARKRQDYLKNTCPDLVIISQGGLVDGVEWMEACKQLGVPYVPLVHLVSDVLWPDPVIAERASDVYAKARMVYFVSKHNRELAALQIGCDFGSAGVVRNPFNVDYDAPATWPIESNLLKIACVGRLGVEHKGQDLLVELMSMTKWRSRPLEITLFGNGHHRGTLERRIADLGCDQVRFGGYANQIETVWREHHGLIMPSRYEGLPIALLEAMLCHRMAIVTDVGGNSELVEDGKSGYLISVPTVRSLDEAMERAWQGRSRWADMGIYAGRSVRTIIPHDPVEVFIQELRNLN